MEEPLEIYSKIQPLIKKEINDQMMIFTSDRKFDVAQIPAHTHTGGESNTIDFSNLDNKAFYINNRIVASGTNCAVASTVGGDYVMQYAGYISAIGATVDTAGTTGTMTIDVKKNGTSIFYTKITIDTGSKTSRSYVGAPVLDTSQITFAVGDIFTFDISTVQTTPAKGLTIFINAIQS